MQYDVYLRNNQGRRTSLVNGIVSLTATFRVNQPVKWKLTGSGLEECPLSQNTSIAIFRNGQTWLCGYCTERKDKYDASTRIYDWEVSGLSDLGRLADRLVFPDPTDETPDPDGTYSVSGYLSHVLMDTINNNAGAAAIRDRQLPRLVISGISDLGDELTVEAKFDELMSFVTNKLKDTDLEIREIWDLQTGLWNIVIRRPQDVSSTVIFSVDNGTIAEWERTVKAPKANWLLVTGCEQKDDSNPDDEGITMSCIVYDEDSIQQWGLIEGTVSRSDIDRVEGNAEEGTTDESWDSVQERLQKAAYEELEKASAQFGYKLKTTEVSRNVYLEDYDIGSIVSIRIGDDEFIAKVEEIKVEYKEGVETVTPSVGTMQRGELQTVFTELGTLKEQIKVLQQTK